MSYRASASTRRIPDEQTLIDGSTAWQGNRNKHRTKAGSQFTSVDARVKLKRPSPTV